MCGYAFHYHLRYCDDLATTCFDFLTLLDGCDQDTHVFVGIAFFYSISLETSLSGLA